MRKSRLSNAKFRFHEFELKDNNLRDLNGNEDKSKKVITCEENVQFLGNKEI